MLIRRKNLILLTKGRSNIDSVTTFPPNVSNNTSIMLNKRIVQYIEEFCNQTQKDVDSKSMYCPRCKEQRRFHKHSIRDRKCVHINGRWLSAGSFKIIRKRCSNCKKVISLFASFLGKYQRVQIQLIFSYIYMLTKGKSFKYVANKCFSKVCVSERTMRRWKYKWMLLLKIHSTRILGLIIQFIPTINLKCYSKETSLQQLIDYFNILKKVKVQFKVVNLFSLLLCINYKIIVILPLEKIPPNLSNVHKH
jgi:hypothetical protein